jgi:hypothetical protein
MPRRRKSRGAGRRGRPTALSRMSTSDLTRELERRRGMLQDLVRQRDALTTQLSELEAVFGSANGSSSGLTARRGRRGPPRARRGKRSRNSMSLAEALRRALKGKTLTVSNAVEAVRKVGYESASPNFRMMVNQALLANKKVFKKIARGEYTAR